MALQTVSGQTVTEPVTLDALKARLMLVSTDDDIQLTGIIVAAREFAERISNRCLAPRQFIETRDRFPFPREPFTISAPPLVSVDSVQYLDGNYDWQTWDPAEYWVAINNVPAILQPRQGFVYPVPVRAAGAVQITFHAGLPLPAHWALNIQDVAVFMYENAGVAVPAELVTIPKIYVF